jgi:serine/threonine protein kinase
MLPEAGTQTLSLLARLHDDQRQRWQRGERVLVEEYLEKNEDLRADPEGALDLIYHEVLLRERAGESPGRAEYVHRFPHLARQLHDQFEIHAALEHSVASQGYSTQMDDLASGPLLWPVLPSYEVQGEIGRGGMGVVYRAWQPDLKRAVAIKMMRAGALAGREQRARFGAEAEAVARLQHPNIVQVHAVGEDQGRPYLVLEYLSGGSLAGKLDGTPLPGPTSAALVETLARAVQHAHERGIVHRDLKPGNVLLQETQQRTEPAPDFRLSDFTLKITDFGLAKHLYSDQGQTQSGEVLGTPSYMAPEQAGGNKSIGPATDVYALGAILYELLTGRPPFKAPTSLETVFQVIHEEPVAPVRLQPNVPRDLETICLKCLNKESTKRYGSAAELAEDLRRFQACEPILARPTSPSERIYRWCRRNPAGAAAAVAATLALSLLAGTAMSTAFALQARARAKDALYEKERADEKALAEEEAKERAEAERQRSQLEAKKTAALADIFVKGIQFDDPLGLSGHFVCVPRAVGQKLPAEAILQHGARRTGESLKGQWEVEATVRDAVGNVYRTLGMYTESEAQLQAGLELRQQHLGPDDLELAASLRNLGVLYHQRSNSELGDYERAAALYEEALAIRRRQPEPDELLISDVLYYQAWLFTQREDYAQARKLFREVLDLRRKHLGEEHRDVLLTRIGMVGVDVAEGHDVAGVFEVLPTVVAMVKQQGDEELAGLVGLFSQALVSHACQHYEASRDVMRTCVQRARRWGGERHFYLAMALYFLADNLEKLGDVSSAEKCYLECLDIARQTVGFEHQIVSFTVLRNYARLLARLGRRGEAESWLRTFRLAWEGRYGKGDFQLANFLMTCADLFEEWGVAPAHETVCREARALYDRYGGPRFRLYTECLNSLAVACLRQGKKAEAESLLRSALLLVRQQRDGKTEHLARVLTNLGQALIAQHKLVEVETFLKEAYSIHKRLTVSGGLALPGIASLVGSSRSVVPAFVRAGSLPDTLSQLSRFCRVQGKITEAARWSTEHRRLCYRDPDQLYEVAQEYLECARLAGAEKQHYRDEALTCLRQAIDAGYCNVDRLKTDRALDSLRGLSDFAAVLRGLERKTSR